MSGSKTSSGATASTSTLAAFGVPKPTTGFAAFASQGPSKTSSGAFASSTTASTSTSAFGTPKSGGGFAEFSSLGTSKTSSGATASTSTFAAFDTPALATGFGAFGGGTNSAGSSKFGQNTATSLSSSPAAKPFNTSGASCQNTPASPSAHVFGTPTPFGVLGRSTSGASGQNVTASTSTSASDTLKPATGCIASGGDASPSSHGGKSAFLPYASPGPLCFGSPAPITNSTSDSSSLVQLKPATPFGTLQRIDPSKQEGIEEFYIKFLLGEELANTQFHLYSARSVSSGRVMKPRVLCANNAILAKSSKYFLNLLSSDIDPSDHSLSDLTDVNDVPSEARFDEYGYESDSDLDEDESGNTVPETSKDLSAAALSKSSAETEPTNDDGLAVPITGPERRTDERLNKNNSSAISSTQTTTQETSDSLKNHSTVHLRSLSSRHILVKDTAFHTWFTLLHYLATGKIDFLPLSSVTPEGKRRARLSLNSPSGRPRCSAKSMYWLACKVGLDDLRDKALSHIQSNLSEHNILREISGSLVHKHPQLLSMHLDVLHVHMSSPSVIANFPAFMTGIVDGEMPQGKDILLDVYKRFMKALYPSATSQTV